jgi:tetratricopeptide (TPR) repeat protein
MTEEKRDSSTHINGSLSKSPIISGEVHGDIIVNYGKIEQQQLGEKAIEYKRPPKPSIFRGESTKIFVGRKQDIDTIRDYFLGSNLPVSITGEGGIGKSELAYKAMHKCKDMFDLIIPVYFESILTFNSFLLEMAKSLNLPIDEFEKKGLEDRRDEIINTLGQQFKHPLIYADNYETIAGVLTIKGISISASSNEEKDNARKINAFLENLPPNTAVLLTSRERYNLDGERPVRLDGLSETEGRDLFIELAKNHFLKGGELSGEIMRALEQLSKKTGGHPLSIELLARSYRGGSLSKVKGMLEHLGTGVVNPRKESEHLQSLESCFEYSLNVLPETHKNLLSSLTLFGSPFPIGAIEEIFGFEGSSEILLDLYDRSLLRTIEFDEYEDDGINASYHLYYFHPATRNYLEYKVVKEGNKQDLEEKYSEQFSLYYYKLLEETYNAVGAKDHVLALERFNIIWQEKDNDFDRAIRLAKDSSMVGSILRNLGLIFEFLGLYGKALIFHNKSLAINEELQDKGGMAKDYGNIGSVLYRQGNYDQALQYHYKSLAIHQELQDKLGMAINYRNIGDVIANTGNSQQAIESYSKGLEIFKELEENTGYHHPLSDTIRGYISQLQ